MNDYMGKIECAYALLNGEIDNQDALKGILRENVEFSDPAQAKEVIEILSTVGQHIQWKLKKEN